MATQRQYEAATLFNMRCVDMRHLWEPSREYLGKPTEKPNYFGMWIVPKTQAHWSTEPVFASAMQAFQKLLGGQLQNFAQNPNAVIWPIMDGDMPSSQGKTSEFAKGHWMLSASTGNVPNIELVQSGAVAPVKLHSRAGVKPGDYCMLGVTAAVKQNQANGVKFYLSACVFTHPGEEIVFANSVSGAELMRQAQAQGLQVAGFGNAPGGFGNAPGGFGAPAAAPGGFGGQPGGFTSGGAPHAQTAPAFGAPSTAPNGPAFGGNAAFPSSAPQGAPGFGTAAPQPSAGHAAQGAPGFAAPNFGQFPGR
jgi:hypothetical protein